MQLAKSIEHTLLQASATAEQIQKLCEEAITHKFFGVCVNSSRVPVAHKLLSGFDTKLIAVVGFPLGAAMTSAKCAEARSSVEAGADEIDMVLNLGWLRDKNYTEVEHDIESVVNVCFGSPVKVILETHLLSPDEKILAAKICESAGAAFVKTCTGFSGGGATLEDVSLLRKNVGPQVNIKASGGIKTQEQALALLAAGATRLGTSSGISLVSGSEKASAGY